CRKRNAVCRRAHRQQISVKRFVNPAQCWLLSCRIHTGDLLDQHVSVSRCEELIPLNPFPELCNSVSEIGLLFVFLGKILSGNQQRLDHRRGSHHVIACLIAAVVRQSRTTIEICWKNTIAILGFRQEKDHPGDPADGRLSIYPSPLYAYDHAQYRVPAYFTRKKCQLLHAERQIHTAIDIIILRKIVNMCTLYEV